ncbi:DUF4974 domain-containing protein [Pseudoflavitalea sp. X16]|uniref:FecR family protein n=1 Tax=Paraflavitalea devenefica TaxID=2716334 RepID=UPI00141E13FD|nr:FecR family protein [Paraflavitalea devenefica]NII29090.1 DUF4974 domain-containing protein [Paraflavitalea devenefica]
MTQNDIIALADKIATGIATDDEIAVWNNMYEGMQDVQELQPEQRQALQEQLRERILQRTSRPAPRRIPWGRWAAAAAVLFMIAGAGYWYFFRPEEAPVQSVVVKAKPGTADIKPGTQQAVLTLADGSTVVLDSQANGTLAHQGNMEVTRQNGRLQYVTAGEVTPGQTMVYNTITTPRGGQYEVVLGDGTRVWLNAASSLRFPARFGSATREVEVRGEAYFEVAKDAAHPFRVHVPGGATVQVLGTHFNINAYDDESMMATTLLEGSVQVSKGGTDQLLKPGDQAQLDNNGHLNVLHNVNTQQVVAWKNGYFQFDKANIKTVMRQLSRWYDVEVEYRGATDPSMTFEGKLGRDLKLQQVLKILQRSEVHFAIEDRNIIVVP